MNHIRSALTILLFALSLTSPGVRAQQADPAPTAQPDVKPDVKPAPKRKPIKRRSVQQVITPTPRIASGGDRPALTAAPPAAVPAPPAPSARLNSCDGGGCTDTNGARYNGGVGNTLIGPRGQLCTKGVVNPQCF